MYTKSLRQNYYAFYSMQYKPVVNMVCYMSADDELCTITWIRVRSRVPKCMVKLSSS